MATIQANLTNLVNARKNIIKAINDKEVTVSETTKLSSLPAEIRKIKTGLQYAGQFKFYINDWTGKPWSFNPPSESDKQYVKMTSINAETKEVSSTVNGMFLITVSGIYFNHNRSMNVSVKKRGQNNFVEILNRGSDNWYFHNSIYYPTNIGDVFRAYISGDDAHVRGEILFSLFI